MSGLTPTSLRSEDDIDMILEAKELPEYTVEVVGEGLRTSNVDVYVRSIQSSWIAVITANRKFAKEVSIKLSRDRTVEPEAFEDALRNAERLFHQALQGQAMSRSFADNEMQSHLAVNRGGFLGSPPAAHAESVPLGFAAHILCIKKQFALWRQRQSVFREIGLAEKESSVEPHAEAIARIEHGVGKLLAEAVMLIASMIGERQSVAGIEVVTHLSTYSCIQYSLSVSVVTQMASALLTADDCQKFALAAFAVPCAEHGGPCPEYTKAEQIRAAQV